MVLVNDGNVVDLGRGSYNSIEGLGNNLEDVEQFLSKFLGFKIAQLFVVGTSTLLVCGTFSLGAFRSRTDDQLTGLTEKQLIEGCIWAIVTGAVNVPSTAYFFLQLLKKYYRLKQGKMSSSEKVSNTVGLLFAIFVVSAGVSFSLEDSRGVLGKAAYVFVGPYAAYVLATRLFGTGNIISDGWHLAIKIKNIMFNRRARHIFLALWDSQGHVGQFKPDPNKGDLKNLADFFEQLKQNGTARWGAEWAGNRIIMPVLTGVALTLAMGILPGLMTMVENGLPDIFKAAAFESSWIGGVVQQLFFLKMATLFFPTLRRFVNFMRERAVAIGAIAAITALVEGACFMSGSALGDYVDKNPMGRVANATLFAEHSAYATYWDTLIEPWYGTLAAILAGCMANGTGSLLLMMIFLKPGGEQVLDKVLERLGAMLASINELGEGDITEIDEVVQAQKEWRDESPCFGSSVSLFSKFSCCKGDRYQYQSLDDGGSYSSNRPI